MLSLAVPANVGFVWLEGDAGRFSVTVGDAVMTVKVTASLLPVGLPSELGWEAWAV